MQISEIDITLDFITSIEIISAEIDMGLLRTCIELISPYLNSFVASLFLLLLFSFFVLKKATARKRRKPPEVAGGWPIIGHLQLLKGDNQLPHETLRAIADKYGPIFRIREWVPNQSSLLAVRN